MTFLPCITQCEVLHAVTHPVEDGVLPAQFDLVDESADALRIIECRVVAHRSVNHIASAPDRKCSSQVGPGVMIRNLLVGKLVVLVPSQVSTWADLHALEAKERSDRHCRSHNASGDSLETVFGGSGIVISA